MKIHSSFPLHGFSLTFPRFPRKSKNRLNTSLLFYGIPPVAACGMILKPMRWWNFICLLILISNQFKLYIIIINLFKARNFKQYVTGTGKPGPGTLEKPENQDPSETLGKLENRELSGTLEKLENQDPSGILEKRENRDPSGTPEKLENRDPSGTLVGP